MMYLCFRRVNNDMEEILEHGQSDMFYEKTKGKDYSIISTTKRVP